jgi:hypothetical protein
MNGAIFQYQNMMMTVVQGMASGLIPALQTVSYIIMLACLVLGIYEAYAKGGDTRQLAATVMKYVVVAFVVGNWTAFFSDLTTGFNQIAQYIDNSYGAGDLAASWANQLSSSFSQGGYTNWWNIINDGAAAIVNSLEIAISYIIFPIAIQIFTLIYTFWGAVVFAMGPLVLAVAPSQSINSTAKFYAVNLVMWNCWTIIYAVFACLITAVHGNDLNAMMNGGPFFNGGMIPGSQPIAMIGLTSILYSVCILLIPLIAGFVLKAEFRGVGGSLIGMVLSAMQVTRFASAMGAGSGSLGGGGLLASSLSAQSGLSAAGGQGVWTTRQYAQPSQPPRATPDVDVSASRTSPRVSEEEV